MAAVVPAPAARCAETATSFATLEGIGDWIGIAVELDGCRRTLETYTAVGSPRAAAASEHLIALLHP